MWKKIEDITCYKKKVDLNNIDTPNPLNRHFPGLILNKIPAEEGNDFDYDLENGNNSAVRMKQQLEMKQL